jgi:hypothetical protein
MSGEPPPGIHHLCTSSPVAKSSTEMEPSARLEM